VSDGLVHAHLITTILQTLLSYSYSMFEEEQKELKKTLEDYTLMALS
jgi:hypothetical protein